MEKFSRTIAACIFPIIIYSCDGGNQQGSKPAENDSATVKRTQKAMPATFDVEIDCDYHVDSSQAADMVKAYKAHFPQEGLTPNFKIGRCVIESISQFLNNNSRYDGIRFFFGAEKKAGPGNRSKLLVVPTTEVLSPTESERHTNQPGVQISLGACAIGDVEINKPIQIFHEKVNRFGKDFRKEKVEGERSPAAFDQFSLGVWMAKCKIDSIMALFSDPANSYDALTAIVGAYYKSDTMFERGQRKYVVQTTLIFVPTTGATLGWAATKNKKRPNASDGAINHGELCPTICD